MAGIGFEIRKIYSKGTLASKIAGGAYAFFATLGPVAMSMVSMLAVSLLLQKGYESDLFFAMVPYIFLTSCVMSAMFGNVASRYVADQIYVGAGGGILPSLVGLMIISSLATGALMIPVIAAGAMSDDVGLATAFSAYLLSVSMSMAYATISYLSTLRKYVTLTILQLCATALSALLYFPATAAVRPAGAACLSLAAGYAMMAAGSVALVGWRFGSKGRGWFRFTAYISRYPYIALAALLYTGGLYLPSVAYWFGSDIGYSVGPFVSAPEYDLALFVAIVASMPMLIVFAVSVETAFYDNYRGYLGELRAGSYDSIEAARAVMESSVLSRLTSLIITQGAVCVALSFLVCPMLPGYGVSAGFADMLSGLIICVFGFTSLGLITTCLYYCADARDAFIASVSFFVPMLLCVPAVLSYGAPYWMPLGVGSGIGCAVAFAELRVELREMTRSIVCRVYDDNDD